MNYRKLRIIIFSLFVPFVFFIVGVFKAVVQRLFLLFSCFFLFVPFVFADVPSGGWATGVTYLWGGGGSNPGYTYTPSPSGSTACKMVKQVDGGSAAFVDYTSSVVTGSCSSAFVCTFPYYYAVVCSDALKTAYFTPALPDGSCPAGKDWVGGCNGTLKYCEGSPLYINAVRFLNVVEGAKSFVYETIIASDATKYLCVTVMVNSANVPMITITSPTGTVPDYVNNNYCVKESAYNALNNTSCNSTGTVVLNGKNSNIYKGVGSTGITTTTCKDANGVYTDCPGSVITDIGGGVTITQDPLGIGPTIKTDPGGGTVPVTTSGSGTGVVDKVTGTSGNCYDGIKNGDEIGIDKGGRCATGTGTGTEPSITWSGSYTGGSGSGKSPFTSSTASDNSRIKTLTTQFMNDMKASSFFSMPVSLFRSFPSGGSPDITFSAGRFGTHTYNFSTAWASIIPLLKGIIIAVFGVVSVKVIVLKGGGG